MKTNEQTTESPERQRQIRVPRDFTRPLKYRSEYCDMLLDYFESAPLTAQASA